MIKRKIIVVGGDCYNTLGIIRTLGEANYKFDVIFIRGDFIIASKSKYLKGKKVSIVNSVEEAYYKLVSLKKSIKNKKVFLIVEGDNLTGYLDKHYNSLEDKFIWNNAGVQRKLSKYLNKKVQVDIAEKYGINVMPSVIVNNGTIPEDIEYPVMTKAVSSEIDNWKSEVFICNSKRELKEAFSKIKSPTVMLQKFIKKTNELCLDGYSINRGRQQFITIASKYNYLIDSGFSYYGTIYNFNDQQLQKKITNIMTDIGYEGIYSFEFLEDQSGKLYFLEINFRNSGWSYASTCAGMPLPILWIKSMINNKIDETKKKQIKDKFTFIDDFSDFRIRVLGGKISLLKWFKEYKECDCKLILGRNDMLPLLVYIFSRVKNKLNKIQKEKSNEIRKRIYYKKSNEY